MKRWFLLPTVTYRYCSLGLEVADFSAVMQSRQAFLGICWDVLKGAEYDKANAGLCTITARRHNEHTFISSQIMHRLW